MANERDFDVRLLDRNVSQGLVKEEDFQKFLKDLPDVADNADVVGVDFERSDEIVAELGDE